MINLTEEERETLLNKTANAVRKHIIAKTSRLFVLFYSKKEKELEKELKKLRTLFNATAFFRTTIKNLFERKKPEALSFRISFPIKVKWKDKTVYSIVEGEAVLTPRGKYKVVNSSFTLIFDNGSEELEIINTEVNDLPKNINEVLSTFVNVLMCSTKEELKEVIPQW